MNDQTQLDGNANRLLFAWLIALFATLAALFIGEILGQTPCLLCWYQRIAMFPLAVILGIGVYRNDIGSASYAKPLAWAGLAIAAWHVGLYFGFISESLIPCGKGPSCTDAKMDIFGLPIPALSLGAFAIILFFLHSFKGRRT
ncbi:MAG: disulfide bond formation protein B [Notoacmeibacter sp.]